MDWQTLISTAALVFLAELGDKTQLAVITQTCKFGSPWAVFFGGSLALTSVTALGVLGGQALGALIPQSTIRMLAAAAFLLMGFLIWRETQKGEEDVCPAACDTDAGSATWNWQALGATFSLLFLAELGDKTQLAVLGLASRQAALWLVFSGSAMALITVTGLGVVGGRQLCRWIPQRKLLRVSAVAFAVMGVLIFFGLI